MVLFIGLSRDLNRPFNMLIKITLPYKNQQKKSTPEEVPLYEIFFNIVDIVSKSIHRYNLC